MAPSTSDVRFLRAALAAALLLTPAAAHAMARKPAVVPASTAPAPAWLRDGDGTAMPGPDEIAVRWLGTAGFEIRTAKTAILIDPYYSRPSLGTLIGGPAKPDEAAIAKHVRPVDGIFVGHTHFDHMMDAPTAAKITHAVLYGSDATQRLAAQEGLPAPRRFTLRGGERIKVGDLYVDVVASRHSTMVTQHLAGGDLPADAKMPLWFLHYKNDQVFGFLVRWRGRTIYHCGSADVVEANLAGKRADAVLACVSGWTSAPDVFKRLADALHPAVIFPMHHDDFFKPFEEGVHENLLAKYGEALDRIRQDAPGVAIREVRFFDDTRLRAEE